MASCSDSAPGVSPDEKMPMRRSIARQTSKAWPSAPVTDWPELGSLLRAVVRSMGWVLFLAALVLTALLLAWILLGIVLMGSGPSATAYPIPLTLEMPLILLFLLAMTSALGWGIHRSGVRWRTLGFLIGSVVGLVTIVLVTFALSSPLDALWLARDEAWAGSNIWDYQKYPQQPIVNPSVAYVLPQNLSRELFETIDYTVDGQPRESRFQDFLASSNTTSFIVLKDGALVYEGYANGYSRDSIVTSYSIAKSFTSALIGKAIDEGYIGTVDDPIVMYLPELRGRGLDQATIRDLLIMSAGISFAHQDEQPAVVKMLPFNDDSRATNFPDLRSLALSVKAGADAPGTAFDYNDNVPVLLGMILERTTHRPVAQYLQEKIWKPAGMEYSASWSLDRAQSGLELMFSGLNGRAIDFARFGQLYLDNGRFNGSQIIPQQWVLESTAPDPNDGRVWRRGLPWKNAGGYYKYLWWGQQQSDGSYAYMARGGNYQQWIYVSPVDRVVIVRFAAESADASEPYVWPAIFQTIVKTLADGR
jgi:CubicO group peptidase (beta-lactamase class C family)